MTQFRSPLIWRLILWFLLLSLIPIGVVLVFVQRQVRATIVDQQLQGLSDQARLLSLQIAQQPGRTQEIIEEFSSADQQVVILDDKGNYIAHSDPNKVGANASTDVNADILQQLQTEQFAKIDNSGNRQYIGSAKTEKNNQVVAIIANSETRAKNISDLSRGIILQLAVSLLITSLAGGAAILVVLSPLLQLSNFADRLGGGELDAEFDTVDLEGELAMLAKSLNNLAVRVRNSIATLEQRVAERTEELQKANAQISRRAAQFEGIARVSSAISSKQELNSLLPEITNVISRQYGFYHVGIFMNDNKTEYAVLTAANSEGGQRMLARNHRLKIGETGIVGYVTAAGRARIALDTGEDPVFFNNPDLPETHSEIALPLKVGEEVIGALDVQSSQPNAFSQEDIDVLTILADQVSIAIQKARQYEETRKALTEADTLYRQFIQENWQNFVQRQKIAGIRHSGAVSSLLYKSSESDHGKDFGGTIKREKEQAANQLNMPVKLHGEVIGSLNVRSPVNREWNQDEIDILNAIMERAALALENARLLAESQKRAAKERAIGEISTKISALIDVDDLLQTAAKEIGRTIPGAEITIQLQERKDGD